MDTKVKFTFSVGDVVEVYTDEGREPWTIIERRYAEEESSGVTFPKISYVCERFCRGAVGLILVPEDRLELVMTADESKALRDEERSERRMHEYGRRRPPSGGLGGRCLEIKSAAEAVTDTSA